MAIADIDWTRLLQQAQIKLSGASVAGIKSEAFEVIDEFFKESRSWLEPIAVNVLGDGTLTYDLTPTGGQIIGLMAVVDQLGFPQAASMPTLGTLQLAYPSNTAVVFSALVEKSIVLPTTKEMVPDAPDWLLPRWHHGILDGVIGKMANQRAASYSDDKLAAYHLWRFRDAITQAKVEMLHRNTFGGQAWVYPQSFRVSTQRGGISVGNGNRF